MESLGLPGDFLCELLIPIILKKLSLEIGKQLAELRK
jgi:hypothetical protein